MRILKKGLRYLRGRTGLGLVYDFRTRPTRTGVYGFFYASHADDVDTRKSTIAYVFFYSGCAISWKSKLHTFITTSTNHSELVAAAMASREAKFLWKFFGALNIPTAQASKNSETIDLFTDSMGVVSIARNSVLTSATKHMEIADFYVRELVTRGIVTVAHVQTGLMLADVLTKPLAKIKFFRFINAILGIAKIEDASQASNPQWDKSGNGLQHGCQRMQAEKNVVEGARGRKRTQSHSFAAPKTIRKGRPVAQNATVGQSLPIVGQSLPTAGQSLPEGHLAAQNPIVGQSSPTAGQSLPEGRPVAWNPSIGESLPITGQSLPEDEEYVQDVKSSTPGLDRGHWAEGGDEGECQEFDHPGARRISS